MKNKVLIGTLLVFGCYSVLFYSCKKSFLNQPPQGVYSEDQLTNKKGVDGMLIAAYASLDGVEGTWYGGGSNWVWGSVQGGDALKGSEASDQVDVNPIMKYSATPGNPVVANKWTAIWDGVGRANQVLKSVPNATDMSADEVLQTTAEARFIRAWQLFEGKKVFNNIPYVDENTTDFKVPNTTDGTTYVDIWPQIEADLQFAFDNLDATKPNKGRVNKWAAAAYLAKAYMFEHKYPEAKTLFDNIIANGVTAEGTAYELTDNYEDNFRVGTEHNSETVFAIESSYGDGSTTNGNYDETLAFPHGGGPGAGCCGFFQPSQNFVNSFKTTAGLPMPTTYNNADVTSDRTLLSTDPFTPYTGDLDPRLDWSVGRRGIPFLDWGLHPGRDWIRKVGFGGPYAPKKNVFYKADLGATAGSVGWGWNNTALNVTIMRFADVLLMSAEADIEAGGAGGLITAQAKINLIRARAAASPIPGSTANYDVALYTVPFAGQDEARTAVRFERKLELGMEGHRFFDLVRWGIADVFINNEYLPKEAPLYPGDGGIFPLSPAVFTKNKNEYAPIPDRVISQSIKDGAETLKQNPGF